MYKDLEKIIVDNKLNNEFKSSKIKVLFIDRFKLDLVIKFSLIAKIFNEKYNYEPIIFHEYRKESHLLRIYKYFNL